MQEQETTRGKIELNIGGISFSGEGDQSWLAEQVAVLIEAAKSNQIIESPTNESSDNDPEQRSATNIGSLNSYLKSKGAENVQVQRFLATAAWLNHRGEEPLTSSLVSRALRDNQQKRLGNPADCLNQNVGRGFCEKKPDGFFITPEGWRHLGEDR